MLIDVLIKIALAMFALLFFCGAVIVLVVVATEMLNERRR